LAWRVLEGKSSKNRAGSKFLAKRETIKNPKFLNFGFFYHRTFVLNLMMSIEDFRQSW